MQFSFKLFPIHPKALLERKGGGKKIFPVNYFSLNLKGQATPTTKVFYCEKKQNVFEKRSCRLDVQATNFVEI